MTPLGRQPDLFEASATGALGPEWQLSAEGLRAWQERVLVFQLAQRQQSYGLAPGPTPGQICLFAEAEIAQPVPMAPSPLAVPDPLDLIAESLQFWRWPEPPHQGAALYFVFDHSLGRGQDLLLYLGETCRADRRWKGDHDCKHYLAAYGETLVRCGQTPRLSIRFWCDAPSDTRRRRQLEQTQIRHWQPPFNKECRQRWQTPFQNQHQ